MIIHTPGRRCAKGVQHQDDCEWPDGEPGRWGEVVWWVLFGVLLEAVLIALLFGGRR